MTTFEMEKNASVVCCEYLGKNAIVCFKKHNI